MWQDWCITIIQLSFAVSALPMAIRGPYPPLSSSVPTTVGMIALAAIMGTMGLWFAAGSLVLTSIVWSVAIGNRIGES
jgi:hypothetical protein